MGFNLADDPHRSSALALGAIAPVSNFSSCKRGAGLRTRDDLALDWETCENPKRSRDFSKRAISLKKNGGKI